LALIAWSPVGSPQHGSGYGRSLWEQQELEHGL